jgi:radical SAM superfamily enzyme YgiQ (UPF0313 family)
MTAIVLATLNARWIHAAFGLRCLRANLGELHAASVIEEFELAARPSDVVERILAHSPRLVGLGVYVWNAAQSLQVARLLAAVAPEVVLVVGGPEVSHETETQPIAAVADCVVRGEADLAFADLCRRALAGAILPRVCDAPLPHFADMVLPYAEYTDVDVAHRIVYVEASRGCPFTCEFCLSSLDIPVRQAPLPAFLGAMQGLLDRGVRHFKFVDRTFNLNVRVAAAILEFFGARMVDGLFLHFEMVPDRLPAALREPIAAFPAGMLQFEVGIQTFDPVVGERIQRRQDTARLEDNLQWLRQHTGVHVHADLIVGLPGEDLASFARGFDRLIALRPHEIQVGILKRLRGTPIGRHDAEWQVVWNTEPPYELLCNKVLDFPTMQRLKRFARAWDLVANSGNFTETLALLLAGPSAFAAFLAFSDWLFARTQRTHGIALHRLAELVFAHLVQERGCPPEAAGGALAGDYLRCARHDWPEFLRPFVHPDAAKKQAAGAELRGNPAAARQARHHPA